MDGFELGYWLFNRLVFKNKPDFVCFLKFYLGLRDLNEMEIFRNLDRIEILDFLDITVIGLVLKSLQVLYSLIFVQFSRYSKNGVSKSKFTFGLEK